MPYKPANSVAFRFVVTPDKTIPDTGTHTLLQSGCTRTLNHTGGSRFADHILRLRKSRILQAVGNERPCFPKIRPTPTRSRKFPLHPQNYIRKQP